MIIIYVLIKTGYAYNSFIDNRFNKQKKLSMPYSWAEKDIHHFIHKTKYQIQQQQLRHQLRKRKMAMILKYIEKDPELLYMFRKKMATTMEEDVAFLNSDDSFWRSINYLDLLFRI